MNEQEDEGVKLDPVAEAILSVLQAAPDGTCQPKEVAEFIAEGRRTRKDPPDLWRRYLMAVNQQARFLARTGAIDIIRKGEVVDPHAPIKGLIKLRLAES